MPEIVGELLEAPSRYARRRAELRGERGRRKQSPYNFRQLRNSYYKFRLIYCCLQLARQLQLCQGIYPARCFKTLAAGTNLQEKHKQYGYKR